MILINCAIAQKRIIELVEEYNLNGEYPFSYVKTQGIRIYFNSLLNDDKKSCDLISNIIQKHEYASILHYNVLPFNNNEIKWF